MRKTITLIKEYPFTTTLIAIVIIGLIAIAVFIPQGWIVGVTVMGSVFVTGLIGGAIAEIMR